MSLIDGFQINILDRRTDPQQDIIIQITGVDPGKLSKNEIVVILNAIKTRALRNIQSEPGFVPIQKLRDALAAGIITQQEYDTIVN